MWLVPEITAVTNASQVAAALSARVACASFSVASGQVVSCVTVPTVNGRYHVMAEGPSPVAVLSASVVTIDMVISSVSDAGSAAVPVAGSVGGGTVLTIAGSGFPSSAADAVVFVRVQPSTTFLNGLVLCDILTASATQIMCRTRAHLAADTDANDPMARLTRPTASLPAAVQVVACPASMNTTILKECCWGMDSAAKARCGAANDNACKFRCAARAGAAPRRPAWAGTASALPCVGRGAGPTKVPILHAEIPAPAQATFSPDYLHS